MSAQALIPTLFGVFGLVIAYFIYQKVKAYPEGEPAVKDIGDQIHLTDTVTISEKAWRTPGSRMFVEVDTQVTVEQLLKGMIIQSGNDASVALAEHVAGAEETLQ